MEGESLPIRGAERGHRYQELILLLRRGQIGGQVQSGLVGCCGGGRDTAAEAAVIEVEVVFVAAQGVERIASREFADAIERTMPYLTVVEDMMDADVIIIVSSGGACGSSVSAPSDCR
jgi:hypothetical protein